MKIFFLSIIFIVSSTYLFGDCDSQWINEQNILNEIEDKEFVALVRILKVVQFENQYDKIITFETIRHYKGKKINSIKYADRITITPGEEWLLINDSKEYQSQCYSKKYKDIEGFIDQGFGSCYQVLNYLDQHFKYPLHTKSESNKYPNGKIRWEVKKSRGQFYYPDGSIYMKESYADGSRNGKTIKYSKFNNKTFIYEYDQDTLTLIKEQCKKKTQRVIKVNRYGKFVKKLYTKKTYDILYKRTNPYDSIEITYIRTIINSSFKKGIVEFTFDTYVRSKNESPNEEYIHFDLNKKSGRTNRSIFDNVVLIQKEKLETKNDTYEILVLKEENSSWLAESNRIICYSPNIGIFYEVWSDSSTLKIEEHIDKIELINFANSIIKVND